jgi:hypothetical protein
MLTVTTFRVLEVCLANPDESGNPGPKAVEQTHHPCLGERLVAVVDG